VTDPAELLDADGHVLEDERSIAEHLGGTYGEVKRRQVAEGAAASLRGRVFPPLGFVSSMPIDEPAKRNRAERPEERGDTPQSWEYFLEAVGISKTVLYPSVGLAMGRVRDLGYAVALARAYNDWMAETYLRRPSGRFQAAALLPMQVPEAAAAELRRAVDELGFCAAVLPAHGLPNHLGSELYFPVYRQAQELDVALACHGGVHEGFGFDDFNVFAPVHAIGHPLSQMVSLAGMLFNRVFDLFPNLRVAFLEGGAAWILMASERFSESFRAIPPADPSISLQLHHGQRVRDYLVELMQGGRLVLGCEGGEDFLVTAIDHFGCMPFMYSSDFPHEVDVASCRHEVDELDRLAISDADKRLLRGDTARRFYRL
jgi:predicted TIM-barrel fold metal-dependent hydrolase